MNYRRNILTASSLSLGLLALTACSGGSSKSTPPPTEGQAYASACASLTGCVTIANGFQFPDGSGGTVSCVSGACTDNSSTLQAAQAAYNSGYSSGYSTGSTSTQTGSYNQGVTAGTNDANSAAYNNGYNDGVAANAPSYNSGYSAGQNDGYNSGYSVGQTSGYSSGYTAGQSDSYNSGYNDGYNSNYSAGQNNGYNDGYNSSYNSGYNDGYSSGYSDGSSGLSVIGSTKDTDLQKAQAQQMSLEARANSIAQQMGMSVDKATQMVQLTDQVKQMAQSGQMTQADRMAIANSALKIAGVSETEVNTAIASAMKGDMSSANDLMDKAAKNLGMNSGADVRDKLIPSVGLVMP